jgi:hypothetical protein
VRTGRWGPSGEGVGAGAVALLCGALLGAPRDVPGPERVTVGDIAEPQ